MKGIIKVGKLHKDNKGFSAVETIMIPVIVILIGLVGWLVYKNNHKTNVATSNTKSTSTTTTTTSDPYAGWKTGTTKYEKLSYKYPSNWNLVDNSETGSKYPFQPGADDLYLLSPTGSRIHIFVGVGSGTSDVVVGSTPITFLGGSDYLNASVDSKNYADPNALVFDECIATNPTYALPNIRTKNITSSTDAGGNVTGEPVRMAFCFSPLSPSTPESIKSSADFATAKLIFESMHY